MVWVVGIAFAIQIIQSETGAAIFDAVEPLRDVTIVGLIAWFLVRFIRTVETNLIGEKEQREEPYDRATYDAIAKLLRMSVVITAVLVALQTLGYSIAGCSPSEGSAASRWASPPRTCSPTSSAA